jgi:hypothetical protein
VDDINWGFVEGVSPIIKPTTVSGGIDSTKL